MNEKHAAWYTLAVWPEWWLLSQALIVMLELEYPDVSIAGLLAIVAGFILLAMTLMLAMLAWRARGGPGPILSKLWPIASGFSALLAFWWLIQVVQTPLDADVVWAWTACLAHAAQSTIGFVAWKGFQNRPTPV